MGTARFLTLPSTYFAIKSFYLAITKTNIFLFSLNRALVDSIIDCSSLGVEGAPEHVDFQQYIDEEKSDEEKSDDEEKDDLDITSSFKD